MSAIRTLTAASLLFLASAASAETWQLDPSHTRVGFRVDHMMVSSVEGQFPEVSGELELEPGKASTAEVTVEVQMATVNTGNDQRDEHLRTSDFLDVANYPTMTFTSTSIKTKRDGFSLTGDLTIRGVTKRVTFTGKGLDQVVIDPWGNQRVGAHATTTIDRQEFGVAWNQALEAGGLLVGNDLDLQIDVEFTRPNDKAATN
ncbi:MAG: polyisoprenoid-binding protein [Deltaproteobacteria bacterium]|nr:MAG: polyisoprenoid-binding protein [Deltaproteobacteria bacterium]